VAQVGNTTVNYVSNMLKEPTGLPFSVAAIADREGTTLGEISASQVVPQNVSFELAEHTAGVNYPVFYVYCERITNQLREKFRTFSGKARLVIDVRVSQDRLEGLARQLELYVEAATDVLDAHRGTWGQGMFYTGGYEVNFGTTKHGGKNFIQAAKITVEADVSI